jgi:hypothetical protein
MIARRINRSRQPIRIEIRISGDRKLLARLVGKACGEIWGDPALLKPTARPGNGAGTKETR